MVTKALNSSQDRIVRRSALCVRRLIRGVIVLDLVSFYHVAQPTFPKQKMLKTPKFCKRIFALVFDKLSVS